MTCKCAAEFRINVDDEDSTLALGLIQQFKTAHEECGYMGLLSGTNEKETTRRFKV